MCVQANAPSMISILADGLYQLFYPARGMDENAITSSKNFFWGQISFLNDQMFLFYIRENAKRFQ